MRKTQKPTENERENEREDADQMLELGGLPELDAVDPCLLHRARVEEHLSCQHYLRTCNKKMQNLPLIPVIFLNIKLLK